MLSETDRKAIFRENPMVYGFLGTALEDLQYTENEEACEQEREARDVGTIYTAPEATFRHAVSECEAFRAATAGILGDGHVEIDDQLTIIDLRAIGSDLYLERAGHGAGFRDRRELGSAAAKLSAAVSPRGTLEIYAGDDGQAWFSGAESLQ